MDVLDRNDVFQYDTDIYDKKIETKPIPEPNIGIDTSNSLYKNIIQSMEGDSTLTGFNSVSLPVLFLTSASNTQIPFLPVVN